MKFNRQSSDEELIAAALLLGVTWRHIGSGVRWFPPDEPRPSFGYWESSPRSAAIAALFSAGLYDPRSDE